MPVKTTCTLRHWDGTTTEVDEMLTKWEHENNARLLRVVCVVYPDGSETYVK